MIDCGTLARDADQIVAAAATHVAWVLPATAHGVEPRPPRAPGGAANGARELIVARNDVRQSQGAAAATEAARRRAARAARAAAPPHPAWRAAGSKHALDDAQVPVQAILGALRR